MTTPAVLHLRLHQMILSVAPLSLNLKDICTVEALQLVTQLTYTRMFEPLQMRYSLTEKATRLL